MKTKRYYILSNSLDELEAFEELLELTEIDTPQIHVLSQDDVGLANHRHLHEVQSLMKLNIVHSVIVGIFIGLGLFAFVLFIAYHFKLTSAPVGWVPFIFLAIIVLGFSAWVGGLIGIQKPNYKFTRFDSLLASGKHVIFIDLLPNQIHTFENLLLSHPNLESAGIESSRSHWLILLQRKVGMFRYT